MFINDFFQISVTKKRKKTLDRQAIKATAIKVSTAKKNEEEKLREEENVNDARAKSQLNDF